MAVVYQATNLINGKRYIGVTSQKLSLREYAHWKGAGNASRMKIHRAMKKYGRDMIRFRVLKKCGSFEEALSHEVRLIESLRPEYNINKGGNGYRGKPISEDEKKKRRQPSAWKRFQAAGALAQRRAVICLNDGMTFNTSKDAAVHYRLSASAICRHLRGRSATCGGRIFEYFGGNGHVPEDFDMVARLASLRIQASLLTAASNPNKRQVICIDDGEKFDSVASAARHYGIVHSKIYRVACGLRRSTQGRRFEFAA